ncbi:MAG: NAD-dependent epimerase/dehydratase family protein [Actinobacteria bacterium]|nr:NAD-dependent epimerase/dehydratase family protein [Actinomycetota bacterium]
MRILFIGGTRFVGRAIAEHAMNLGHEVTLVHRGNNPVPGAENIITDRESGLDALAGRQWDATVDVCAYRPHQVDAVADALGDRAGRYVFISTVSVYASNIAADSDESAEVCDTTAVQNNADTVAIDAQTYGPLKVLAERQTLARFQAPLIIRPTYVIGPHDYTMRFPTWVQRIAEQSTVECPEPADAAMQYIDARDQAAFVLGLLQQGSAGAFHCAAPKTTFGEMLTTIKRALNSEAELVWSSAQQCENRESEFPLWAGGESAPMLQMNPAAALSHGLRFRDLVETVIDTYAWLGNQQTGTAHTS